MHYGTNPMNKGTPQEYIQALGATQTKVLDFIQDRCHRDDRPPTHDEIAAHFGWKVSHHIGPR